MADTLIIRCNNVPRNVIYWHELSETEKKEFDYLVTENDDNAEHGPMNTFFRYKGNVYDLHEFMRIDKAIAPHCQRPGWEKFDGYSSDSFFSGILVRYANDHESVIVGQYFS